MSYYPVKELALIDTGTNVDFSITNITAAGYTDIKTLTADIKKIDVVHNGGGEIILRKNATDIGFIAPGYKGVVDCKAATGDVIRFKSVSGTISSGKIYINYVG